MLQIPTKLKNTKTPRRLPGYCEQVKYLPLERMPWEILLRRERME